MKSRSLLYLAATLAAVFILPTACSNDAEVSGDGDSTAAGDGDGDVGGSAGGEGDGDINSGDGDAPRVITCDGVGTSCDATSDCCSGYCDPDSGSCSCGPAGRDCRVGDDCCSGQCNPTTNTCAQILGTCGQEGVRCDSGTECCTLSCVDGACSADACVQDGEACSENGECCGGKCEDEACVPINSGSGANCSTAGNSCTDGGDCCSGLCTDEGLCGLGASFCVQLNDLCSQDSQCCQGVCMIADGDTSGYCGTQETGGTRCGEKKISGEVCGGDCSECCSRTCAPYGPSGLNICQPPTGCRIDGELCRTSNDCCGGNPDSSIPGAGQAECLRVNPDDEVGRCKVGGCNPHGAICGSPDDGTAACGGSLSAPNGQKCCGKNALPADVNPCSVDSLLIPRCDVLEGCVEPEGECATADDCCNGNPCVQDAAGVFTCYETTDMCVEAGGPCTANADCCVGSLCLLEPGQATGVCGNNDPPGGTGGGSGTGGSSSGTGGSSTGTGGSTSCAEYGQSCETHDDCCGDTPCDVASHTCRFPVVR